MKKKILSICAALSAIAILILAPGCKTATFSQINADGTTNIVTKSVPDVAQMQAVAKSAAYLGTTIWLQGIPPNVPAHPADLQKFVLARNSLKTLIAAGTFSAADLTSALQALPVKQFQGTNGSLIVGEAVILWDQYGQQLASLDKAQVFSTYILPVAQSILDGLNMALPAGL